MDGLLLLLWHKEQRVAGAAGAGYGVAAAATPLTFRNSIIPREERKSIRSRTPPIDRQRKKASTNTGTAGLRNPNR